MKRLQKTTSTQGRQAVACMRFRAFAGRRLQPSAGGYAERSGRKLAAALQAIEPGRATSRQFEDACIAALRYLFAADLAGWYVQLTTEDRLQRRDLACRIIPRADVWRQMWDRNSHYVVFEFKNYKDRITQKEVFSTERYLRLQANRRVAIIISPQGCAPSAQKVMSGAVGDDKLILSLTVEDIATWLIRKDEGADPNAFLSERVDRFLLGIGR